MVIPLLMGLILGAMAGLGIGGGSLLMLWLTLAEGTDPEIARGINLMFFIVAAGTVSLVRRQKEKHQLCGVFPAATSGCIAAAACSLLAQYMDTDILRTILGVLFLITGIKELLYRPTNAR